MKIKQQKFQEIIKEEIHFELQGRQLLEHIKRLEASGATQQKINEDAMDILRQFGSMGKELGSNLAGIGKEAGADLLSPEKGTTLAGSIKKTIITNVTSYILRRTFNIGPKSQFGNLFADFIGNLLGEIDIDDIKRIAAGGDQACEVISDTVYDSAIRTLFKKIIGVIQEPVQNAAFQSLGLKSDSAGFLLSFVGDVGKEGAATWISKNTDVIADLKKDVKQKLCHYIKNFNMSKLIGSMFS